MHSTCRGIEKGSYLLSSSHWHTASGQGTTPREGRAGANFVAGGARPTHPPLKQDVAEEHVEMSCSNMKATDM